MDLERLDEALAYEDGTDTQSIIIDAARAYRDLLANGQRVEIHTNRLRDWHTLHITDAGYKLDHPLYCDLDACDYQTHAEGWAYPPDEVGLYRWEHEAVLESWMQIDPEPGRIVSRLLVDHPEEGTVSEPRDLLANGQRVEWCETHESRVRIGPGGRPGDERCERAELHLAFQPSVGVRTCRIVSKLLVDYPKEAENE